MNAQERGVDGIVDNTGIGFRDLFGPKELTTQKGDGGYSFLMILLFIVFSSQKVC